MKKLFVLVAVVAFAAMAVNNAEAGSRKVGVEAGYVSPEDLEGTWTAGVFMDFGLPMVNWSVSPFVNYWKWSESVPGAETSFSDWSFGGNLKYTIPTAASNVQPFVGAGVSAHRVSVDASADFGSLGVVDLSASETKFGFQAGGGLQFSAGERANFIASSWYHMVDTMNQWSVMGGIAWNI